MRLWLTGILLVALSGCISVTEREPAPIRASGSVSAGGAPAASGGRHIISDGTGGLTLPDGITVVADAAGGFTLPNGAYVAPDGAGGIILPNGARCVSDGAGGYRCP